MPRSTDEAAEAAPTPRRPSRRPRRKDSSFAARALCRIAGVGFLGLAILYGLVEGEHIDTTEGPAANITGRVAGYFGYAADDIRIGGLRWQSQSAVLSAVGVRRNGPLFGFDPATAKRLLENLDWVESAQVQRLFPNQLEISIVEREPFAIWQRDGSLYVIDATGVAISSVAPRDLPGYIAVTGEGAQRAAGELVNHLEAYPAIRSLVRAGARVGDRRWTLYLKGNVKVLLPETGVAKALAVLDGLHARQRVLDKGIEALDLRVADSVVFTPLRPQAKEKEPIVVSRR